ncbi:MAG TPA: hypothetical protein PLU88_02420 [Armatimonadota bacterium]|nr:hypothetical protein [Armatimonadota bacterium]
MVRNKKLWIVITAAVITVAIVSAYLLLNANHDTYTETQAQADLKEVLPLVEKVTGRKLKKIPGIRIVTADELASIITSDIIEDRTSVESKLTGSEADQKKQLIEQQVHNLTRNCLGKYDRKRKLIYLVPSNVSATEKNTDRVNISAKLTLAHELVHALQDQYGELDVADDKEMPLERSTIASAILEGQAYFTAITVADLINSPKALEEARMMLGIDQGRAGINLAGIEFIAWHFERGGSDQVWNALDSPPSTIPELFHPEGPQQTDYADMLSEFKNDLGLRGADIKVNKPIREWTLKHYYYEMDDELRSRVFQKQFTGHMMILRANNGDGSINLYIIPDQKAIHDFISMVKKDKEKECDQAGVHVDIKYRNIPNAKADIAKRLDIKSSNDSATYAFIARGPVLIRVGTVNSELYDEQAVKIAEEIFRKIPIDQINSNH